MRIGGLLLAVVMGCGVLAPSPASAKPEPPLRFATYNVCKTSCGAGEFAWARRKAAVIRTIRSARPDVLALQEVDNSYAWIAQRLAKHGYAVVEGLWDTCVDGRGCVDDSRLYYRTARVEPLAKKVPSEPVSEPCRLYISDAGQLITAPSQPATPDKPTRRDYPSRSAYEANLAAWTTTYQPLWDAYRQASAQYYAIMRNYEDVDEQHNCSRFVGRKPFSLAGNGNIGFATIGKNSLEGAAENRNFAWGVFRDRRTDATFMAVSMHMPNEKTDLAEKYRENLARRLPAYLDEMGVASAPTVLMGDFNSYRQRQPRGVQWIFGKRGFRDAFSARVRVHEDVPTVNMTSSKPDPFPARPFHFDSPARLDYVMFDQGTALRYEVHLRLKNGLFDNRYRGSDHNLLLADLRLPRVKAPTKWAAAPGAAR